MPQGPWKNASGTTHAKAATPAQAEMHKKPEMTAKVELLASPEMSALKCMENHTWLQSQKWLQSLKCLQTLNACKAWEACEGWFGCKGWIYCKARNCCKAWKACKSWNACKGSNHKGHCNKLINSALEQLVAGHSPFPENPQLRNCGLLMACPPAHQACWYLNGGSGQSYLHILHCAFQVFECGLLFWSYSALVLPPCDCK